ncbi:L,D-transpeptidase [Allokutzneria albata]|uniref:Lipoprotein-anchoring transpeptidase ErfK/SrfK n=1 Tax=Allokutzneria albata TaxID=211114 RepID=A0A1G9V9D5_ALLAB|nr:Ig-like domain-containing protein [Allokutzneria albata]SDM68686.1 Lipoprotein-anchoring transpeptidase ErfK/SrfK [Allokutzneria albata]
MARARFVAVGLAMVVALGQSVPPAEAVVPQQNTIVVEPADRATDVAPDAPLRVRIEDGTLDEVTLTDADGRRIQGVLSMDRRGWTATEKADFDKDYSYSGTATGADGARLPITGTFRTVTPRLLVTVSPRVAEGGTYGVAQPVWLVFPKPGVPPRDRAAVEKAVSVESSPVTEGAWAWIDAENLVWRPKDYWQPGTKVTVRSGLRGVRFDEGVYGKNDFTRNFTIGRHQLVRADTGTFRLIVERDGVEIRNYPASYGDDSDPKRTTRSGRYFVMSKQQYYYMQRYDFDAYWALRLSIHGEFIHANQYTVKDQGRRNVSHGCANLSMKNAEDYYRIALEGDPVVVTGSAIDLPAKGADFWAYPWPMWTSLSAVKG